MPPRFSCEKDYVMNTDHVTADVTQGGDAEPDCDGGTVAIAAPVMRQQQQLLRKQTFVDDEGDDDDGTDFVDSSKVKLVKRDSYVAACKKTQSMDMLMSASLKAVSG